MIDVTIDPPPTISFIPLLDVETELIAQFGCVPVTQEFQAIAECSTIAFQLLETYSWLSLTDEGLGTASITIIPGSNDEQGIYSSLTLQAT